MIYWSIHKTFVGTEFAARSDAVDEVFQEVFQRLLDKKELAKLRDADSLRKFLSVIASHVAMDKVRSLSRLERKLEIAEGDEELANITSNSMEAPASSREISVAVSEILEALPPRERLCVEWHYMDGKSHRQIGEILGIPEDTVTSIIRRTREKLRARFTRKGLAEDL